MPQHYPSSADTHAMVARVAPVVDAGLDVDVPVAHHRVHGAEGEVEAGGAGGIANGTGEHGFDGEIGGSPDENF